MISPTRDSLAALWTRREQEGDVYLVFPRIIEVFYDQILVTALWENCDI